MIDRPAKTLSATADSGEIIYTYWEDDECTETEINDLSILEAGTYYVKAVVEGTGNYDSAQATADFTIYEYLASDTEAITYTRTGNDGDGHWQTKGNWDPDRVPCKGYPSSADYATAKIDQSADIDLCSSNVSMNVLYVDTTSKVTIRNGGINYTTANKAIGKIGYKVVFSCATNTSARLEPATSSSTALEGSSRVNNNSYGYRPWNSKDEHLTIRNGDVYVGAFTGYLNDTAGMLLITNAILRSSKYSAGSAPHLDTRNGDDYIGRMVVSGDICSYTDSVPSSGISNYRFEVPAGGWAVDQPPVVSGGTVYIPSSSMVTVDVSAGISGRVELIRGKTLICNPGAITLNVIGYNHSCGPLELQKKGNSLYLRPNNKTMILLIQ